VFTFDITASSNGDYVAKSEVVTLDGANAARSFVVTITDDNKVENAETFGVNVTTVESLVTIQDETVVITITDDDGKLIAVRHIASSVVKSYNVRSVVLKCCIVFGFSSRFLLHNVDTFLLKKSSIACCVFELFSRIFVCSTKTIKFLAFESDSWFGLPNSLYT
jgi:hypothetical protein